MGAASGDVGILFVEIERGSREGVGCGHRSAGTADTNTRESSRVGRGMTAGGELALSGPLFTTSA